ncbi:hypothetical protein [Arenibaculum sp.]|jgi:hypothetical protein|uniref:hypothetical protein n=1 Tax=Arenibaculum sp. TaxID=2865862 RepID=UPI002E16483E|nr:hypothetical protein [Arenibaculum sp.]
MILASCSGAGEAQVCAVRDTCVRHRLHGSGAEREMQARPFGHWGCRYFLAIGNEEDERWLAAE